MMLNAIEGLIVLVEFEKDFDSLAWDFILTSLDIFSFTSDTIKWVNYFIIHASMLQFYLVLI